MSISMCRFASTVNPSNALGALLQCAQNCP